MSTDASLGDLETINDIDAVATGGAAGAFAVRGFAERYQRGESLGAGGMGIVQAWRDRATGREVAMKTIRGPNEATAARRFAREARVQAQLEHPSIVPVYDVGVDPSGALYASSSSGGCASRIATSSAGSRSRPGSCRSSSRRRSRPSSPRLASPGLRPRVSRGRAAPPPGRALASPDTEEAAREAIARQRVREMLRCKAGLRLA